MRRLTLYVTALATALWVHTAGAEAPQSPTGSGYYLRDYAEITSQSASSQPWWSLTFDLLVKLGLVVGLIYLVTWVLRTYVMGPKARGPLALGRAGGRIDVLESTTLAPHRTLYLVEVADRVLVLGSTQTSLSTLAEIRDADAIQLLKTRPVDEGPSLPNFAEQLKSLTGHLPVSLTGQRPPAAPSQFLQDKIGELRSLATQFRRPAPEADRAEA